MTTALDSTTVTITNGTAVSGAAAVPRGYVLAGVIMSAAWTAASITFQASYDGTNFFDVYDRTAEVVASTAAANRYIPLDPAILPAAKNVKVRSGTGGVPVNQAADRVLTLVFKPL